MELGAIARYLDRTLGVELFAADDQNGVYRASQRPIERIGLALEPWHGIGEWVRHRQLDALFLHRPWRLDRQELPPDLGVVAYHLAFDFTLTFGLNHRLAEVMGMREIGDFGHRDGAPLGMVGSLGKTQLNDFVESLEEIFETRPTVSHQFGDSFERVGIVGGMSDKLVREAAERGVETYVTGEYRPSAKRAVEDTRMNVLIVGHAAGEEWGLRALSGMLRERWAGLETVFAPKDRPHEGKLFL